MDLVYDRLRVLIKPLYLDAIRTRDHKKNYRRCGCVDLSRHSQNLQKTNLLPAVITCNTSGNGLQMCERKENDDAENSENILDEKVCLSAC